MQQYLEATRYLDADHEVVRAFADRVIDGTADPVERAVRLYYAVRDEIRYDPYAFRITPDEFRASAILTQDAAFCVPKAIALAAAARAVGVPSRLGFADVRNHLSTKRLTEMLGNDLFVFHGYTELHLGGRWLKATPTFNVGLCDRFGVKPLEFDGHADALLHAYDREGNRHMEYVVDRGTYADFPLDEMISVWHEHYPQFFEDETLARYLTGGADAFEAEAASERDATDAP